MKNNEYMYLMPSVRVDLCGVCGRGLERVRIDTDVNHSGPGPDPESRPSRISIPPSLIPSTKYRL